MRKHTPRPFCTMALKWYDADDIDQLPHLHSDAMHTKLLLLACPDHPSVMRGWYLGGLIHEFRAEGTPSNQHPILFAELPDKPL